MDSKQMELQKKELRRLELSIQLSSVNKVLSGLESDKEKLKKKIKRFTVALKKIESQKSNFDSGKQGLQNITISSSSWKGEKANQANLGLEKMKSSSSEISTKIEDIITIIEIEKRKAENQLEDLKSQIRSQNAILSSLMAQLNSL